MNEIELEELNRYIKLASDQYLKGGIISEEIGEYFSTIHYKNLKGPLEVSASGILKTETRSPEDFFKLCSRKSFNNHNLFKISSIAKQAIADNDLNTLALVAEYKDVCKLHFLFKDIELTTIIDNESGPLRDAIIHLKNTIIERIKRDFATASIRDKTLLLRAAITIGHPELIDLAISDPQVKEIVINYRELDSDIRKSSNQVSQKLKELRVAGEKGSPHFVIMTAAPWGSSGDTAAAAKFIKELKAKDPTIKITWTIQRDAYSSKVNPRAFGVPDDVEILDYDAPDDYGWNRGWGELEDKEDIVERIEECTGVISFPTTHYLSSDNLRTIASCEKPLICITEYDFQNDSVFKTGVAPPDSLEYTTIKTGFSSDSLGVFADPASDASLTDILSPYNPDEPVVDFLFQGRDEETYKRENHLFFGYYASDTASESEHCIVNKIDYAIACIKKSLREDKKKMEQKDIDIFLPIKPEETDIFISKLREALTPEELGKLGIIDTVKKNADDNSIVERSNTINPGEDKVNVRLYNGFRLTNESFKTFARNSDRFGGFTGDQSFVEALISGRLVAYQQMNWKEKEFRELLNLIRTHPELGPDSPIYKFYSLQIEGRRNRNNNAIWDRMVNVLVEGEDVLSHQAEILASHIKEKKNLANTLIRRFTSITRAIRDELQSFSEPEKIQKILTKIHGHALTPSDWGRILCPEPGDEPPQRKTVNIDGDNYYVYENAVLGSGYVSEVSLAKKEGSDEWLACKVTDFSSGGKFKRSAF